ncbi:family 20 glycosylhydrolase [Echinicola vietnamensis]|uniref:N-acetyl-beta-hexosaminidase n=1 Tax=Echinicola vietnamensis (strain DSM 17526 / LMG 23754 / KMM 6221) TaxID=926556 RepID=L0G695_ECHVK|nr:family 20 glycosylhydrolase [Echinicola vietnamensis]AGA80501.1 N-acetyl-beta-hexosaminidase [Echinicola vietnamensis DSM 17526]
METPTKSKAPHKQVLPPLAAYRLVICLLCLIQSIAAYPQVKEAVKGDDFNVKGFHLDLRVQVMTPEALKDFARQMADFGLNTLVMEWEATYPFKDHLTIANQFSYSREEIDDFIAYCDQLGIQVVPLQQSLGHVEYILRNPRYSELKEDRKDISQLCPMKIAESEVLFQSLFEDLAQTHNSDYIHIGGDETYLLGHCDLCRARVEEVGKSQLFVDHMKMIANLVIENGKTPLMWADIILKYPEAAAELPKETVFVDWNYGWKANHFGDISKLQELGFAFWGAPSIRSHPDNWYMTNWRTHFNNQRDFIPFSRESGYEGMVMTSWSTSGLYGFTWDVGYDVANMVQIRNTYPMSGFRILIASYAAALSHPEEFAPREFVLDYASERFGLDGQESLRLWEFLNFQRELISDAKPVKSKNVEEVKQHYRQVSDPVLQLDPGRNVEEFLHFKLMAKLRMLYLDYKEVDEVYNSPAFTQALVPSLILQMEAVLDRSEVLGKEFADLNSGFLYDAEIAELNRQRELPMNVLYHRLAKLK